METWQEAWCRVGVDPTVALGVDSARGFSPCRKEASVKTTLVRRSVFATLLSVALVATCSLPPSARTAARQESELPFSPPPQAVAARPSSPNIPQVVPSVQPHGPVDSLAISPGVPTPSAAPWATPAEQTVEGLIARLAALKKARADIERVEGETTALLREKLRQQRQRLENLGVIEEESRTESLPAGKGLAPVPGITAPKLEGKRENPTQELRPATATSPDPKELCSAGQYQKALTIYLKVADRSIGRSRVEALAAGVICHAGLAQVNEISKLLALIRKEVPRMKEADRKAWEQWLEEAEKEIKGTLSAP